MKLLKNMPAQGWSAFGGKKLLLLLFFLLTPIFILQAEVLSEKLSGKILLQVEQHGEAWYVNPENNNRYYLGRPADAFNIMRELGLGISNKDFDSFSGVAPQRLAGKILLKVEDLGKAYYINTEDFNMHYLGRPADAFDVMREQGLGITDSNIESIEIDEDSSPIITDEEIIPDEEEETATSTDEEIIPDEEEETATSTDEEIIPDEEEETSTTTCIWLAEYFNNKNVTGSPTATTTVEAIDFDWIRSSPDEISKTDGFSARFTTNCYFEEGKYEFATVFDDALRVYIDNVNFLQSWTNNNKEKIINRERTISEGYHDLRVDYYDEIGDAVVNVSWSKIE